ncbi:hypothetical protein [Nonomuraea glycinis]|uniref:hypothetical protein n=1 Tax=Nonomuraea glycinis TaxID=2047744 RepID=UPI002E115FDE|nr:hypothetical protein OHA68_01285 [Nonomuraea glycinis]
MNGGAARTHAGWLVRDKGSFYLAMATGWLRLLGVDSGRLRDLGLRPESPVLVDGCAGPRNTLQVTRIEGRGGRRLGRPVRPRFIANPVPHLEPASDIRLACHVELRRREFPEVSLPVTAGDAAIVAAIGGGLDRFFAFVPPLPPLPPFPHGSAGDEAEEDAGQEERLVVADTTAVPGHLADLGSGLIRRLAETAGDGVPAGAFGRFATPERSPAFFDPPSAWPARAHAVLTGRLHAVGAEPVRIPLPDGRTRLAVCGGDPVAVARFLDLAGSTALREEHGLPRQWCPTWVSPGDGTSRDWLHLGGYRVAECDGVLLHVFWERLITVLCGLRSPADARLLPAQQG